MNGGVDFGDIERDRRGAERSKHLEAGRALHDAQLEAGHILDRLHLVLRVYDLPKAVVPRFFENVKADLLEGVAEHRAEGPVECRPRNFCIGEGEADVADSHQRCDRGERPAAFDRELERSGAELLNHRGVAAERVLGEHFDLEAAVRLLLDGVREFDRGDTDRMRRRNVVPEFV